MADALRLTLLGNIKLDSLQKLHEAIRRVTKEGQSSATLRLLNELCLSDQSVIDKVARAIVHVADPLALEG